MDGTTDLMEFFLQHAPKDNRRRSPLIVDMLGEVERKLREPTPDRHELLMGFGMLIHTFSDTYAHQSFTGFASPDEWQRKRK